MKQILKDIEYMKKLRSIMNTAFNIIIGKINDDIVKESLLTILTDNNDEVDDLITALKYNLIDEQKRLKLLEYIENEFIPNFQFSYTKDRILLDGSHYHNNIDTVKIDDDKLMINGWKVPNYQLRDSFKYERMNDYGIYETIFEYKK